MLVLRIALQVVGLGVALAALIAGWHYGILVVGVVAFLLGGHLVRRHLNERNAARSSGDA